MKKAKFLGLALVAAIASTGAGYAYWTDQVTITSSVSTGRVQTTFDQTSSGDFTFLNQGNGSVATGSVALDSTTAARSATVTLSNLYPGVHATKTLKIANDSTIPVELQSLTFAPTISNINLDEVVIGATLTVENVGSLPITNVLNVSEVQSVLNNVKSWHIPSGADITIAFEVNVPMGTTETGSEDGSFGFTVTPVFQQFNK